VIGKDMPAEFFSMNGPRVTVHGFVENLAKHTDADQIALVPLKVGGGMRVKFLDYWSMGIPVVATPVAVEGLNRGAAKVFALADEAGDFAKQVIRLADSSSEREQLRADAFRSVSENYSWPTLINALVERYENGK
jgi:glycosyltransferase involved in cell wall biosynthesis